MESKKLPTPPAITDQTDNDAPSEYHSIRLGHPEYPPTNAPEIVKAEMTYSLALNKQRTIKSILLAAVGAIAGLVYTYLLLLV